MDEREARHQFGEARVARLATVDRRGRPHVVATTFALDGERIYTIVDSKPKRSPRLKRLANIRVNPRVSLLVDHYDEDWSALWWVRADGLAELIEAGPSRDAAIRLLAAKYPQYRHGSPTRPIGPAIVVTVERWLGWSASSMAGPTQSSD